MDGMESVSTIAILDIKREESVERKGKNTLIPIFLIYYSHLLGFNSHFLSF